jgi:hypothetical protein
VSGAGPLAALGHLLAAGVGALGGALASRRRAEIALAQIEALTVRVEAVEREQVLLRGDLVALDGMHRSLLADLQALQPRRDEPSPSPPGSLVDLAVRVTDAHRRLDALAPRVRALEIGSPLSQR